jgi:hypothetical protein
MHTHIFLFFYFFYFLLFLGLGPAQPTWAGLDPASPAWPGHWPKPVTDWAKTDEARVEWLHACIMHSVKVINLPLHRATLHSN